MARVEYNRLVRRREILAAFLKLAILLPALVAAVWLFVRKRSGAFAPVVYAFDVAVLWRMILVIHEHFPKEYYKYVYVVASIAAVVSLLRLLIRSLTRPSPAMLLKRRREAYRKGQCPVCAYPIARGEEARLVQTARALGARRVQVLLSGENSEESPYVCPSCGERLFEECPSCREIRHALLPHCRHCGAETAPGNAA
jgi:predicted RNA-binding Zn-ribbon protein involved in translation (DUF1610 family)